MWYGPPDTAPNEMSRRESVTPAAGVVNEYPTRLDIVRPVCTVPPGKPALKFSPPVLSRTVAAAAGLRSVARAAAARTLARGDKPWWRVAPAMRSRVGCRWPFPMDKYSGGRVARCCGVCYNGVALRATPRAILLDGCEMRQRPADEVAEPG